MNIYTLNNTDLVVTETAEDTGKLLSAHTSTGVTLNVPLFNPTNEPKFTSCTVNYYAANKPTKAVRAKCGGQNQECDTTCASALTITELASGKPYILEIAAAGSDGVPASFKEYIFFRTGMKF